MDDEVRTLKQALSTRYIVALALIGAVMLVSHIVLERRIGQDERFGLIINVAGQQRMLSQRTALTALLITRGTDTADAVTQIRIQRLRDVLAQMRRNHLLLTGADGAPYRDAVIEQEYFGSNGLDQRVRAFLNAGEEFLARIDSGSSAASDASVQLDRITRISETGLLGALDDMVQRYQSLYEGGVSDFIELQRLLLAIGLLSLAAVGFFVLRPIVRSVVANVQSLAAANAELVEFSFRISHDLRAPIASSMGLADIASEALADDGDTEIARHSIGRMRGALQRLDKMIEDVIQVTRNKQQQVPDEVIDIEAMITEAVEDLCSDKTCDNVDIQIDVELPGPIRTKPSTLQQIVRNLFSNALKYQDPYRESPFVSVRARIAGAWLEISVRDNGLGVPERYRGDLFGMFKRFHPRVERGSGLGLYLVRQSAETLGGSVSYNARQPGSEFIVRIRHWESVAA